MKNIEKSPLDSRKLSKIIVAVVIIVMAFYLTINLFTGLWVEKIETEYLESYTYSNYAEVYGIALREESLVVADRDYKNILYKVSDGDRVAKSSVIASCNEVLISNEDNAKLKILESRIGQITESTKSSISLDLPSIESNILVSINELLYAMESNDISTALDYADSLHVYFNQKSIKLNGNAYYLDALAGYEDDKEALLSSYNTEEHQILSPYAGYFDTDYDGYEYLDPNDYKEFTVNSYNALIQSEAKELPNRYIGKVELSPSWYYYCIADTASLPSLSVGQKLTLEFEFDHIGTASITFYVSYISRSVDGKTALRLRSDTISNEIFSLRKTGAHIITSNYSGYRVPSDALRVVDGKDGIYVLSAKRVVFKPVNILYATEDFAIVESAVTTGSKILAEKDAVIIGGKELYDGKIVQQ